MEPQIWVKSQEKWAYAMVIRGTEVSVLKVTGNMLTLKRNIGKMMEALQAGKAPAEAGASAVETLDATTVSKGVVAPGNASLTLYGRGEPPRKIDFSPPQNNADEILQAVLAKSGRTFKPAQEEVGVFEAILGPLFVGGVCAALCAASYFAANEMAHGGDVQVRGFRNRGMKRLAVTAAETLGTTGSIALGAVLALLCAAWAVRQMTHRPERTVWLPDTA